MKKTPSHFTARVEIERQISFFSFGFERVTEVRHIFIYIFIFIEFEYNTTQHMWSLAESHFCPFAPKFWEHGGDLRIIFCQSVTAV